MFSTTFLGHQGWMFQSNDSCLLLDPLLREEFGSAHALDYRVYPPRLLRPEAFPPVAAIVLTHEHDDHFDIASLARLDRKIPVYLSARSSVAGFQILSEMGFEVCPMVPGVIYPFGDLELHPLAGDHLHGDSGDEWDALPLLVRESAGHGSFFTAVDVTLTPALIEIARQRCPAPGLVGWTNNTVDRSHMTDFMPDCGDTTDQFARQLLAGHKLVSERWGPPSAMLICAGGFSFYGSRSWQNERFFCIDTERASQAASAKKPDARFFSTLPGQTFCMKDGVLEQVKDEVPWLRTAPRESWPSRKKGKTGAHPDYEPATGRREMRPGEIEPLRLRLQELAEALAGGPLFRGLYSLLSIETAGRICTFALVLRHGANAGVFEYNPNACCFEASQAERPRDTYLAGLECWATDLLAVLSGQLSPIALSFGRAALWNAAPDRFNFSILSELYRLSHPLRRPAEYYRIYQRLLRESGDVAPVIRAAK